ncbi:MAG: hypothetical protein MJZ03_02700 [archaeon]|nr:hypothetical protein [archaeon]
MQKEAFEKKYLECSNCGYTTHDVLKGRTSKAAFEGVVQCTKCGRVFSTVLRIPKIIKIPTIISDGPVSEKIVTEFEENDIVTVGDEFIIKDGRRLKIRSLDIGDNQRRKNAKIQDVKTMWVQQFDFLNLKVTINDNGRSYSKKIKAEPDDEFIIGQVLAIAETEYYVHAIKTCDRLVTKGIAEGRDIIRIYAKRKRNSSKPLS